MDTFLNEERTDELRHVWHVLAGLRRRVKNEPRFRAIHGLSLLETGVLDAAAETPDIVLGEIGAALGLPKSTLTSMIDRLEAHAYLRRVISRRDRRSYGLKLTRKGQTAYAAHGRFEAEVWRRMLTGLSGDAEKNRLLRALRKMVTGLEKENGHV